jgi:phage gp36-like protein
MAYPYATPDDLFRRYPPIESVVGSGDMLVNTVDVGSVYIADAQGYVDAFLRGRYMAPLVKEPIITQVTTDIAIYRLVEDHAPRVPDMAEKRMIAANSLLYALANGTLQLDPASQTLVTSGGDQEAWSSNLEQAGPVFGAIEVCSAGTPLTQSEC